MHETVELVEIGEAIDLAAKVDLHALSNSELAWAVDSIQQLKAKLAALGAQVTQVWEISGEWQHDGHRSAKVALRHRSRLHGADAHREIALARSLRSMPITTELLAAGEIAESHARRLARASTKPRFSEAEELLCSHALRLSFAHFDKAVTYWEHLVDQDGAEKKAEQQEQARSLHSSKTLSGMGRVDAWLEPIGFETFNEALRSIESELFEEDWRVARAEFGPDATPEQLGRTPAQRRADALVEMSRRAMAAPADAKLPVPLVIIHCDEATVEAALASLLIDDVEFPADRLCELDDGTVITPTQMAEQALRGHVRRIVFGADGVILDFGRDQRFFQGALRLAIQARDRRCVHPGCEIPARRCEIDHDIEWQDGGVTTHDNGVTRCSYHHRRHKPRR